MGRLGVHANVVAVLDLGQEDDGTSYIVTELGGGGEVEGCWKRAIDAEVATSTARGHATGILTPRECRAGRARIQPTCERRQP